MITGNDYQKSWSLTAITTWPNFFLPEISWWSWCIWWWWMCAITNSRFPRQVAGWLQGNERIDEVGILITCPKPWSSPWTRVASLKSPSPLLLMWQLVLLTLQPDHINALCLTQTDPVGPRVVPILSGQGHIRKLTVWVSLTQRDGLEVWTFVETTKKAIKVGPLSTKVKYPNIPVFLFDDFPY